MADESISYKPKPAFCGIVAAVACGVTAACLQTAEVGDNPWLHIFRAGAFLWSIYGLCSSQRVSTTCAYGIAFLVAFYGAYELTQYYPPGTAARAIEDSLSKSMGPSIGNSLP